MADRNRLESGRWQRCQPRVRIPPPLLSSRRAGCRWLCGLTRGLLGAAELQGHGVVDQVVEALAVPLQVGDEPLQVGPDALDVGLRGPSSDSRRSSEVRSR